MTDDGIRHSRAEGARVATDADEKARIEAANAFGRVGFQPTVRVIVRESGGV